MSPQGRPKGEFRKAAHPLVWVFLVLALLAGCQSVPPMTRQASSAEGLALLQASAAAHGLAAFEQVDDISVAYDSHWYTIVSRLQPTLVDKGYRGGSQERLLLRDGLVAQRHEGPAGTKYVVRERDPDDPASSRRIDVRFDGKVSDDPGQRDAAALVADAYRIFLLGPLAFVRGGQVVDDLGAVSLGGRLTDRLLINSRPGIGASAQDRILLFIDRQDRLVRRIRFTLEGLDSTRGAVVEVDTEDHVRLHGIAWPTRFFERLLRPVPYLPAHRWSLLALDINRGLQPRDVRNGQFSGAAAAPARPLAPFENKAWPPAS
ncbi:MAG: hypothetical protein R3E68_05705 [Burkholderiaceae bacterium]